MERKEEEEKGEKKEQVREKKANWNALQWKMLWLFTGAEVYGTADLKRKTAINATAKPPLQEPIW